MNELLVTLGDRTYRFGVGQTIRIGRSPDNDIVVSDPTVSRRHAELRPVSTGWEFENVGRALSFLNGAPVTRAALDRSAEIQLSSLNGPILGMTVSDVADRGPATAAASRGPQGGRGGPAVSAYHGDPLSRPYQDDAFQADPAWPDYQQPGYRRADPQPPQYQPDLYQADPAAVPPLPVLPSVEPDRTDYQAQPGYPAQAHYPAPPDYQTPADYPGQPAPAAQPGYPGQSAPGGQPGYPGHAAQNDQPGSWSQAAPDGQADNGRPPASPGPADYLGRPDQVSEPPAAAPPAVAEVGAPERTSVMGPALDFGRLADPNGASPGGDGAGNAGAGDVSAGGASVGGASIGRGYASAGGASLGAASAGADGYPPAGGYPGSGDPYQGYSGAAQPGGDVPRVRQVGAQPVDEIATALHILVPIRSWLHDPGWRQFLRLLIIPYGLLPLIFIALFASSSNLATPGWAYSLYIAPLWAIAFWLLIRPGQVERQEVLIGVAAIAFSLVWIRVVTVHINDLMGAPGKPLSFAGAIGVGLNEEITKALPILLAALLLLKYRSTKLDVRMWMFLGTIVGLAFGVSEQAGYTLQDIQGITAAQANSQAIVEVLAFAERVFVDGFQHAMWAGVAAFFIGMAVNYPRRRLQLIAFGIAVPAALHALYDWSAGAFGSLWIPIIIQALSLFLFLGYTMSAAAIERQVRRTPMFRGESMLMERISGVHAGPGHAGHGSHGRGSQGDAGGGHARHGAPSPAAGSGSSWLDPAPPAASGSASWLDPAPPAPPPWLDPAPPAPEAPPWPDPSSPDPALSGQEAASPWPDPAGPDPAAASPWPDPAASGRPAAEPWPGAASHTAAAGGTSPEGYSPAGDGYPQAYRPPAGEDPYARPPAGSEYPQARPPEASAYPDFGSADYQPAGSQPPGFPAPSPPPSDDAPPGSAPSSDDPHPHWAGLRKPPQ